MYKLYESKGKRTPLESKPDPDGIVDWCLTAFNVLSQHRAYISGGMGGVMPYVIPLTEIVAYSSLYDILLPINEFTDIIQTLDMVYLNREQKKAAREAEKRDKESPVH